MLMRMHRKARDCERQMQQKAMLREKTAIWPWCWQMLILKVVQAQAVLVQALDQVLVQRTLRSTLFANSSAVEFASALHQGSRLNTGLASSPYEKLRVLRLGTWAGSVNPSFGLGRSY